MKGEWLHRLYSHHTVVIYFVGWFVSVYISYRIYMQKGSGDMTDKELNALLYSQSVLEVDGYLIDAWFDIKSCEKHIDVVNRETREESGFIANGMSIDEVREKISSLIV